MDNINLLYCFDKNYNTQGYLSIYSFLENIKEKNISIYIIHKDPESFELYKKWLQDEFTFDLNIYKFSEETSYLPNLNNKHVSEATYYRLFLNKYLPKEIKNILYVDADVYCYSDISKHILEIHNDLQIMKKPIGCVTEQIKNEDTKKNFLRLSLKSSKYFNAGVMFINLNLWNEKFNSLDVKNLVSSLSEKIEYWDQDVLNYVFDENYLEISPQFNYVVRHTVNKKYILPRNCLVHFAGNNKPWSVTGALEPPSDLYYGILERSKLNKLVLQMNGSKRKNITYILKKIFSKDFFKFKFKWQYLLLSAKLTIKEI